MSDRTHATPTGGFASTAQRGQIAKLAERAGLVCNEEGIPLQAFLEAKWGSMSPEDFLVQLAAIRGYHLEYYWPTARAVTLVLPLDPTTIRMGEGTLTGGSQMRDDFTALIRSHRRWLHPPSWLGFCASAKKDSLSRYHPESSHPRQRGPLFGAIETRRPLSFLLEHKGTGACERVSFAEAVSNWLHGRVETLTEKFATKRSEALISRFLAPLFALAVKEDWHNRKHVEALVESGMALVQQSADDWAESLRTQAESGRDLASDLFRDLRSAARSARLVAALFTDGVAPPFEIPDRKGAKVPVNAAERFLLQMVEAFERLCRPEVSVEGGPARGGISRLICQKAEETRPGVTRVLRMVVASLAIALEDDPEQAERLRRYFSGDPVSYEFEDLALPAGLIGKLAAMLATVLPSFTLEPDHSAAGWCEGERDFLSNETHHQMARAGRDGPGGAIYVHPNTALAGVAVELSMTTPLFHRKGLWLLAAIEAAAADNRKTREEEEE